MASRQRRVRRNAQPSNVLPESEPAEPQRVTRSVIARIVNFERNRGSENRSTSTTAETSRRSASQSRGSLIPLQRGGRSNSAMRDELVSTLARYSHEWARSRLRAANLEAQAAAELPVEPKKHKKDEEVPKKEETETSGTDVPVKEKKMKMLCPICMDDFLEDNLPASCTSCGHIICTPCISQIMAPGENFCPLCCRRQTVRDIRKVFLPTATLQ